MERWLDQGIVHIARSPLRRNAQLGLWTGRQDPDLTRFLRGGSLGPPRFCRSRSLNDCQVECPQRVQSLPSLELCGFFEHMVFARALTCLLDDGWLRASFQVDVVCLAPNIAQHQYAQVHNYLSAFAAPRHS